MLRSAALYLHPVAALGTIALAGWTASLAVRSRRPGRRAEMARRRHARIGPWLYALVVLNWIGGLATVRWLRPDEVMDSGHFTVANWIVALFTALAILARLMHVDARVRLVHPAVGAVALLLCGLQIFLGLQLLP
jgi:Protein of unknown function (DUF4079)